ncbi:MAG TPA: universal stress protein [Steroidobacteraceae bacterium]|jgi:nucleotide-binding universal stress UspA family protein|nr:universal stress protein [Steroidobacteraceae bacterium]
MYEKILVAVDGSATSLRGLDEAIKVAKSTGARLMLVHVVDELVIATDYVPTAYSAPIFEALRESGARILAQAATVVRRADLSCEQKLVETLSGRVADEIVKQAGEWRADLIVMGTHGRRGLERLALGSDAEMVLRLSSVPVLLIRERSAAP